MPVIPINTPNLATDIAQIATFVANILASAPTTFDTLINANFQLKPTQDCDAMILHDFTDYQELSVVDVNNVTITVAYGYRSKCEDVILCSGVPLIPNSQLSLENLDEDKEYFCTVDISYFDGVDTWTKTLDTCYVKDCCSNSFRELSCTIVSKMNNIADTICCYKKVGRKIVKLKDSYLKLSNLYWLYNHSKNPCNDRDQVYCLFNKIK